MDVEKEVSKFERDKESDSLNAKNPFEELMKSIDVVINTMGASKTRQFSNYFAWTENNKIEFQKRD